MRRTVIRVSADGTVKTIGHKSITDRFGGVVTKTRASHVVPLNQALRTIFKFVRKRVDDESNVAYILRRLPCLWIADLAPSKGPILGPFRDRRKAISSEVEWIHRNLLET